MKFIAALLVLLPGVAVPQAVDHLTPAEIQAAVQAKPNSGFVSIFDMSMAASNCLAQYPSESIFTPLGWINALSINAKGQYLPYSPSPEDSARVLTVVSRGCAVGTTAGPTCDSITRVILLSDKEGSVKVEAESQAFKTEAWQNGYGASTACSSMVSKFNMADVQKVRNAKGEFMIATFSGSTLLKFYTVKQKHIKQLGL